ncbi:ubiquitin-conjugating enzyme [Colletotrichum orchidophilum]|uniref:E2 ubiquitin-conjugating enzyme n=1 Tax=Colletotrichum orchidophilum TaxID=1209926 RepID=A0A1G4AZB6_9PEZI|nr:ubiquitin-conjugating enzyme [Colletotrichum orchidophilum]OHE94466.1 ubiquitin-conjugating enzyme [Colletotrichum orchidophilum]
MSSKRIAKELTEVTTTPPTGMTIALARDSDLHAWHVSLTGPENTPYAGGTFAVLVDLPKDYPFKAPVVKFATRIYHPNITNDASGNICLGMLKSENWKPATKLAAVLEAVRSLLIEPLPDDPLEARIADEFKNNRVEFDKNAKQYVTRYAKGPASFTASDTHAK